MSVRAIRFGTEGFRGAIGREFTAETVAAIAHAVARAVGENPENDRSRGFIVGFDTRQDSEAMAKLAAKELAACGFPVRLFSRFGPTPAASFATRHHRALGALMITASHNPPGDNGVKFKESFGGPSLPETAAAIEWMIRTSGSLTPKPSARTGPITVFDPADAYLDDLLAKVDASRIRSAGLRVFVDPLFGAGQGYLAGLLRSVGCEATEIHAKPDPAFGGIAPEPLPRTLVSLGDEVRRSGADLGLALDGDADRLCAVTAEGDFVDPHRIFGLLLHSLLKHGARAETVVKTFSVSDLIDRIAERHGVQVTVTPIGFKHIAEKMRSGAVLLGGEESGGIGFADHLPERDALLAALRIVETVAVEGIPLASLLGDLARKYGPLAYDRVDLPVAQAPLRSFMGELGRNPWVEIAGRSVTRVERLDGIKLRFAEGGWVLFRPSGTEPCLRIYCEAHSAAEVGLILEEAKDRVSMAAGVSAVKGRA